MTTHGTGVTVHQDLSTVSGVIRRLPVAVGLVFVIAIVNVFLTAAFRQYEAESLFRPHVNAANQFAGLATQLGVRINQFDESESVDFYAALVRSRDVLRQLAVKSFDVQETGETTTVLDLFGGEATDSTAKLQAAVKYLRRTVSARPNIRTGMVAVKTTAPWQSLAESLNAAVLELVNDFNLNRRQSRARAEREFIESRMSVVEDSLRAAEDAVGSFLDRNRIIEAPQLENELNRLMRRVSRFQEVFVSLTTSLEQARVEEVRSTPVLTVVSYPQGTAEPAAGLTMAAAIGLSFGSLVVAVLLLAEAYIRFLRRERPEQFSEIMTAIRRTLRLRRAGDESRT